MHSQIVNSPILLKIPDTYSQSHIEIDFQFVIKLDKMKFENLYVKSYVHIFLLSISFSGLGMDYIHFVF